MPTTVIARSPDDPRGLLLFQTFERILAAANCAWADLGAVAVGIGPGPMNGTRVGSAAALGLANALGLGIVVLPSFYAYVELSRSGPQSVVVPLGRIGSALATVTVAADGWHHSELRLTADATEAKPYSTEAMAQAIAQNPPRPAAELKPIYLREPDMDPQFDAFGRPLAKLMP